MNRFDRLFLILCCVVPVLGKAQLPAQQSVEKRSLQQSPLRQSPLRGYFLSDSIEIGRPFRYALTYQHTPAVDVLFPDTARHFAPYRVQKVAVFATQTTGTGDAAISRDSAVYTLVSFNTDSIQLLQVPVRIINDIDCTAHWTLTDTVFLQSKLARVLSDSLATETRLAPLQQQFNYRALVIGFVVFGLVSSLMYGLFGRSVRRQWRLYLLNRQHQRFLRDYTKLTERINAFTAAEIANQAVIMWKTYLEQLDPQPYVSLTTPELAERMNDERVRYALREADQMIYGGTFTPQSQSALNVLSDVATQTYALCRKKLLRTDNWKPESLSTASSTESSPST